MAEKLLVANRGEIAVRIIRAAAELAIPTLAVYSEDDAQSIHVRMADACFPLEGMGPAAYLDGKQILEAAKRHGCWAVHPGYGFLAENPSFAGRLEAAGIAFIGPTQESLKNFGDKATARRMAAQCGIPLLPGTEKATTLEEAREFFQAAEGGEAVMIKALAGGGGRGMRTVYDIADLEAAFHLCRSEAQAAFGNGDLYLERLIRHARHIEVQVIGDGSGAVSHLWERECSLQRRHQKIMEVAPSPALEDAPALRERLTQAAVALAEKAAYRSLGTFEFLVDAEKGTGEGAFYFLEVNPRLQVEHPVTEEVTGIDLVKAQLEIAGGRTLQELGLSQDRIPAPSGYAVELRVNMESYAANGDMQPSGGALSVFEPPLGPGIRVDTFGYQGYVTNPKFDSLLCKLICHSRTGSYKQVLAKAYRALCEFRIQGVETNIRLLQGLLRDPQVAANKVTTRFVEDHVEALLESAAGAHEPLYHSSRSPNGDAQAAAPAAGEAFQEGPAGTSPVLSPMPGTVFEILVATGDPVHETQKVAILESMKMQHTVEAKVSGVVRQICVAEGDTVFTSHPLLYVEPMAVDAAAADARKAVDPGQIRPDLAEAISRHQTTLDEYRPEAVAKRRNRGQRTARENVADLVDPGSFVEYGALAVAAQRRRHTLEELIERSPADGLITGTGTVNAERFGEAKARCIVMAYDYTVLAGTQGAFNHQKKDRMLHMAEKWRLPVVVFAEGGGGRPGDVDAMEMMVAGLHADTFPRFASLSGLVPIVGIVSGMCFAGNATLLACSDVIIATKNANIGMGGPAMIEGGGLGKCRPEEIGPAEIQAPNGVIDILVEDEAEATAAAKQYLSYFQGPVSDWECADQRLLRHVVPENRLQSYDVREAISIMADTGSVLELRKAFGIGIVTALIRIEGVPFGLTTNNCFHLGGAIDVDAADKCTRFIQLLDAHDIPLITLCDTPGFMVGPEAEKSAQVRHFGRMFTTGAGITIPIFTVILRKGYGLGAQAMVGGGYHQPVLNVSWPTGEFGPMNLEGAVHLGFRKELEAVEGPGEKRKIFDSLVAESYEHGKAINMARFLEIDDVIDPKDTRHRIMRTLRSLPPPEVRTGKKRPNIDTW
jgi:acetyl/propionyl-CoA carboxylase alpha subunit